MPLTLTCTHLTSKAGTSASASSARLVRHDLVRRILWSRFCSGGSEAIILPVAVKRSTRGFTRTPSFEAHKSMGSVREEERGENFGAAGIGLELKKLLAQRKVAGRFRLSRGYVRWGFAPISWQHCPNMTGLQSSHRHLLRACGIPTQSAHAFQ